MDEESFIAILPSNSKGTQNYTNTPSKFNTILSNSLHLVGSDQWFVALKELTFIDTIMSISQNDRIFIKYNVDNIPTFQKKYNLENIINNIPATSNNVKIFSEENKIYYFEMKSLATINKIHWNLLFYPEVKFINLNHDNIQLLLVDEEFLDAQETDLEMHYKTNTQIRFISKGSYYITMSRYNAEVLGFIPKTLEMSQFWKLGKNINAFESIKLTISASELKKSSISNYYLFTAPFKKQKRMSFNNRDFKSRYNTKYWMRVKNKNIIKKSNEPNIYSQPIIAAIPVIYDENDQLSKIDSNMSLYSEISVTRKTEFEISLKPGYYKNGFDLINCFPKNELIKHGVKFEFNEFSNRLKMTIDRNDILVSFSRDLASILGFIDFKESKNTIIASRSINFMRGISSIFLYCDICQDSIVGDVMAPLLRTVHFKRNNYGDPINILYTNPVFIPLCKSFINSIEIILMDDLGQLIPIEEGKTIVTLQFKQISAL